RGRRSVRVIHDRGGRSWHGALGGGAGCERTGSSPAGTWPHLRVGWVGTSSFSTRWRGGVRTYFNNISLPGHLKMMTNKHSFSTAVPQPRERVAGIGLHAHARHLFLRRDEFRVDLRLAGQRLYPPATSSNRSLRPHHRWPECLP